VESQSDQPPIVAIVGETGSGKTALAIALAQQFNGEIICADSRTIYKGMDIGTAKPSTEQRHAIPHHLLDVVDPNQAFSAAQFKRLALEAIDAISHRGKLPILVGGTGLYVDAVLFDYQFAAPPNAAVRQRLQAMTVPQLQAELIAKHIALPENDKNPRHLMRAIETAGTIQNQRRTMRAKTLVLGVATDREIVRQRIEQRVDAMLHAGLADEVRHIAHLYGWQAPGMLAPGYAEWHDYFEGNRTAQQVRDLIVQHHLQLAKRQRTWFKRNKSIHWISKQADCVDLVTTLLNK
jgi:tRNA dimethylallyltransferase